MIVGRCAGVLLLLLLLLQHVSWIAATGSTTHSHTYSHNDTCIMHHAAKRNVLSIVAGRLVGLGAVWVWRGVRLIRCVAGRGVWGSVAGRGVWGLVCGRVLRRHVVPRPVTPVHWAVLVREWGRVLHWHSGGLRVVMMHASLWSVEMHTISRGWRKAILSSRRAGEAGRSVGTRSGNVLFSCALRAMTSSVSFTTPSMAFCRQTGHSTGNPAECTRTYREVVGPCPGYLRGDLGPVPICLAQLLLALMLPVLQVHKVSALHVMHCQA